MQEFLVTITAGEIWTLALCIGLLAGAVVGVFISAAYIYVLRYRQGAESGE